MSCDFCTGKKDLLTGVVNKANSLLTSHCIEENEAQLLTSKALGNMYDVEVIRVYYGRGELRLRVGGDEFNSDGSGDVINSKYCCMCGDLVDKSMFL